MALTRSQRQQLNDALLEAFSLAELARLIRFGMDENLEAIAAVGSKTDIVFELVDWAERRGRIDELIAAAQAERPQSKALAGLASGVQVDDRGEVAGGRQGASTPATNTGAVILDLDNTNISGSTFNINVSSETGKPDAGDDA